MHQPRVGGADGGVPPHDQPEEQSDVLRKHPDAEFVWLNMVFTWKNFELPFGREIDGATREAGARYVACGNTQVDGDQLLSTGKYIDESLWTKPPSLVGIKAFFVCAALLRLSVTVEDFKGAYLAAPLRGPPVYFIIHEEAHKED